MLKITELPTPTHEHVVKFDNDETGLHCVIGVHSTHRGPALGGTRFWSYKTEQDVLNDVLALSEAMTYKNAAAELPYGGGKAVINLNGVTKTKELLQSYAEAVNYMNGAYITAEDVGCMPGDLEYVSQFTNFCVRDCVSSSPATALGVLASMEAAIEVFDKYGHGYQFNDCSVVVQGAGNVGSLLAEMLVQCGAEVFITDINQGKVEQLIKKLPAIKQTQSVFDITSTTHIVRIFAPCALGPAITSQNIEDVTTSFDVICGAANNAVEKGLEGALAQSDVLYCPDFIANAGGVISVAHDLAKTPRSNGLSLAYVATDVLRIHERMREVLTANFNDTMQSAMYYARSRL